MKIVIKMLSTAEMRRRHKVAENGPVQAAIDSECMRYMSDYMPRRQAGELKHLMVAATTIGSGQIDTPGPFAHYLYEGILKCHQQLEVPGRRKMRSRYQQEKS